MGKNWKAGDTTGVNPKVLAEIRAQAAPKTEPADIYNLANINELAQTIYENAKAHGWWEEARSKRSVRSLITSEHAEALEAFRDSEPNVWFKHGDVWFDLGDKVPVSDVATAVSLAEAEEKPLGIGIELVDGLIRALDWIGGYRALAWTGGYRAQFSPAEIEMMKGPRDVPPDVVTFPEQIDWLTEVLYSEGIWRGYVMAVLAVAKANDIDVWECIRIKHAYNITRPYKHGGKKA